ncbi:hypothetical protein PMIN03_013097 [Paraphaeosphaeria minitans]
MLFFALRTGVRLSLQPRELQSGCTCSEAFKIRDESLDERELFLPSDEETTQELLEHYSMDLPSGSQAQQFPCQSSATEISDIEAFLLPYDGESATTQLHVEDGHVFTLLATIPVASQSSNIVRRTDQSVDK